METNVTEMGKPAASDNQNHGPADLCRKKYEVMKAWVDKMLELANGPVQVDDEDIQDLYARISKCTISHVCSVIDRCVEDTHGLATNPKTHVALVGGSGHGKSSLINALVSMSNVVTASSMRASTSVPTEVC